MGQYFVAVNQTKKEYACPWCLGGTAKLWEWCVQPSSGIFPYLLRKSSGLGGGDVENLEQVEYAGRWAGDQIELVGDYDEAGAFQKAFADYDNISPALAAEFNQFMGGGEGDLAVCLCGTCSDRKAAKEGQTTLAIAKG